MKKINESGKKYNRLLVICENGKDNYGQIMWKCLCDCGNYVDVRGYGLRTGKTKSCGCFGVDLLTKHGMTGTVEHDAWKAIIQRCTNPNNPRYKIYGGRGITISNEWLDFECFYSDMGKRPPGKSIDRKNNDLGYSKDNCRWATRKEQDNNTSKNHFVTHDGTTKTVTEWAEFIGLSYECLRGRFRKGWSAEKALTTSLQYSQHDRNNKTLDKQDTIV